MLIRGKGKKREMFSPQNEYNRDNQILYARRVILEVKQCYKNNCVILMVQWCNLKMLQ